MEVRHDYGRRQHVTQVHPHKALGASLQAAGILWAPRKLSGIDDGPRCLRDGRTTVEETLTNDLARHQGGRRDLRVGPELPKSAPSYLH